MVQLAVARAGPDVHSDEHELLTEWHGKGFQVRGIYVPELRRTLRSSSVRSRMRSVHDE